MNKIGTVYIIINSKIDGLFRLFSSIERNHSIDITVAVENASPLRINL